MGTDTSLDDILNGAEAEPQAEPAPQPEPQAEAAPAQEPAQETQPRDEHGRFAPKGDSEPQAQDAAAEGAPPAPKEDEGPTVPRKALQDERSKRQTLEQQLQQLQQQVTELQQPKEPPPPPPSIFDDEQGWQDHFKGDVIGQAVQQASFNARLDMSEMMVRQAHPDFEEKKAAFIEAMKSTPGLQQRALSDPHPWNYAYQYVSNQQRMQELSAVNVADLEAKLRAQIEAEYQAKAQATLKNNLPASVPPSLSQERNVGNRSGPDWAGPPSLGDILNAPR